MARIVRYEGTRVIDLIPDGVVAEWEGKPNVLINPDESQVQSTPISQWRVVGGGILRPATPNEIAADTAGEALAAKRLLRQRAAEAFAANSLLEKSIALYFLDQVNTLRASMTPPLSPITPVQMRNGIISKMNSGDADAS